MPDEKKRTYQSATLGLPPLQMVLVHAEDERANRTRKPLPKRHPKDTDEMKRMEAIIRLIENLEK
jgi:hypothetical protein